MAVTNFQYITRMSSGFKVYILEGQPNLRSEDRFRHISDRVQVIPAHPHKQKHSSERGWTLEERRERAVRKSLANTIRRSSSFSMPESPTSTWSPKASPTHLIPSPVYATPVSDEPLPLIKKSRREPEKKEEKNKTSDRHIQIRPSVITCASSSKSMCRTEDSYGHSTVIAHHSYDHVEEHFQRSLGVNYHKGSSKQLSISVSVDDHFAKALGEKWLELQASSSFCASSSSPSSSSSSSSPSSPTFIHSPCYIQSPKQICKDSVSKTTTTPSLRSGN